MPDIPRVVEELLGLVSIEQYGPVGVAAGERLLVAGLREGAANLYLYDGRDLVRVNVEPISGIAQHPYGSDLIVFYRDVERGREQHLIYTVDVEEPGVERRLSGMEPARILGLAYDGERIVYSAATEEGIYLYQYKHGDSAPERVAAIPGIGMISDARGELAVGVVAVEAGRFNLLVADLRSGSIRVHRDPEGSVSLARIAPDGSIIYAVEGVERAHLRVYDPGGGRSQSLELPRGDLDSFAPRAFNYIGFTPSGGLLAVARRDGRSRVFLDGGLVEAPEGMHGTVVEWRGSLAAGHTSLRTPSQIVALPGGEPILSGRIPEYVSESLGDTGFWWVESFDGSMIPTFTLESKRAPKPGPTVVLVHGGPFSEDSDAWDVFAASLAILGFHVVMPNYRGSTGYGEEWRLKIVGDPCGAELEDITRAALWARESGLASQLYIMGYSYGGYMTLCSLTRKPGLYRAGVAGAAVADWEEMYNLSDAAFKQFIEMMFAGKRNLWGERSPITYVENLREPLCIIHPQNDSRTPLKQMLHFMERALEAGKTFEAHIAPDMGHVVNTVDDVVKILLPAALFLIRHRS